MSEILELSVLENFLQNSNAHEIKNHEAGKENLNKMPSKPVHRPGSNQT